jgi:hypothetical protein
LLADYEAYLVKQRGLSPRTIAAEDQPIAAIAIAPTNNPSRTTMMPYEPQPIVFAPESRLLKRDSSRISAAGTNEVQEITSGGLKIDSQV